MTQDTKRLTEIEATALFTELYVLWHNQSLLLHLIKF